MMNTKYLTGADHKKSEVRLEYTKDGYRVSGWRGPLEYTGELAWVCPRCIPSNWLEWTIKVYKGAGSSKPKMDTMQLA